jgi:regulatory protein
VGGEGAGPDARQAAVARRAGRLLGRRAHSTAELRRKLAGPDGGDEDAAVADVIVRLGQHGVLDDAAFAAELAAARLARGHGPLRVAADLTAAGVDESIARTVIDGLDPADVRGAAVAALGGRTGAAAWRRLAARGFEMEMVVALLEGAEPCE